jgi:hypothetical protein
MAPRAWFATNARNLLESRRNGYVPSGPVVVSMIGGEYPEAADTLYLREDMPLERMDWRMLVDVEVHLWANRKCRWAACSRLSRQSRAPGPRGLSCASEPTAASCTTSKSATASTCARSRHPREHRFTWCPINLTGSGVGAKLRRALLAQHPAFTTL